ncbi:MAG: Oligopeptide transport ATP-binding protein OppF [Bacillota bacterium]|jgi:oligopeptide transport system ATP-binding protein
MANMIDYTEKVLQVKNLKKYFRVGSGRRKLMIPAVDDVTLDVYKREVFGVVGESGSGKTTLGRTIIKLYQPTDGTVMLNNITISVGIQGYLEKIADIKRQLNEDILKLNPAKIKGIELKKEVKAKIEKLQFEKQELLKQKEQELKVISKLFDQYRADKYQITALMQIENQKVIFDFNQKVMKTKQSLQNEALLKFNNEIKIANEKLSHKLNGLKDSAALDAKTIEERIAKLKADHEAVIQQLKSIYEPQIQANATKVLTKAKSALMINQFASEKTKALLVIKEKFQKDIAALVSPDKAKYEKEVKEVTSRFAKKTDDINKKISQLNSKLRLDISKFPTSKANLENQSKVKEQVQKLKTVANLQIKELQAKIADAKRINGSKDTLKESQKMQMIFQDPISSLNPRMTVKEIISEGLVIQGNTSKKDIEKKVAEVLTLVGLSPEYASRYPHEFSGGQRQRIGVARALIMDPNVIIADEPISALDVSIRAQVINLLFTLREKLGLTILFIAHDLSVVRFFCDRIAVMYNGKVVEMASSEELFKNPLHPYTVSLLSAIPQPDPDYEKNRKRIHYNPRIHQYSPSNLPKLREVSKDHFVLLSDGELAQLDKSTPVQPKQKKGA